jgi:hypothetical protein
MWICGKCSEQSEDTFDACWKCGATRDGRTGQESAAAFVAESGAEAQDADPLKCPRCTRRLDYVGRKRFHEGTNWGFFGEVGELFVKREHFDVYVCPRCGRVEMFVDGIGEDLRREPS